MQPALRMYRWALEADPTSVPVLNNMAWHLATDGDPNVSDPRQAIEYATTAAELTKYRSPAILDTLAVSYAAANQLDRARSVIEKAIELARQEGQTEMVERLEAKRLEWND